MIPTTKQPAIDIDAARKVTMPVRHVSFNIGWFCNHAEHGLHNIESLYDCIERELRKSGVRERIIEMDFRWKAREIRVTTTYPRVRIS